MTDDSASRPRKKILITHVYSRRNKGDAALVSVLIEELRRKFDEPELSLLTLEQTEAGELFEGVPLESNFVYQSSFRFHSRGAKLAYAIFAVCSTLTYAWCLQHLSFKLWLPKNLRSIVDRYADADLIVAVGGGYLAGDRSLSSIYNTALILHPFVLSHWLGKPTVLFSQSAGPFKYSLERRVFAMVMNSCITLALIREDRSIEFLESVGVGAGVRAVDSGFLLESRGMSSNLRETLGLPADQLIVGVTARAWLDSDGQERYEVAMASAIDHMITRHGAVVVFIPQVTAGFFGDDDRIVARSVAARIVHDDQIHLLEDEMDCHQLKSIYEDIDLLLGTRFHSVIFSLTSIVPALVVEYQYKASGIMADLDLSQWVVKIEDVTPEKLSQMLDELVEGADGYRDHLELVIPPYRERAREAVEMTKRAYEAFIADKNAGSGKG